MIPCSTDEPIEGAYSKLHGNPASPAQGFKSASNNKSKEETNFWSPKVPNYKKTFFKEEKIGKIVPLYGNENENEKLSNSNLSYFLKAAGKMNKKNPPAQKQPSSLLQKQKILMSSSGDSKNHFYKNQITPELKEPLSYNQSKSNLLNSKSSHQVLDFSIPQIPQSGSQLENNLYKSNRPRKQVVEFHNRKHSQPSPLLEPISSANEDSPSKLSNQASSELKASSSIRNFKVLSPESPTHTGNIAPPSQFSKLDGLELRSEEKQSAFANENFPSSRRPRNFKELLKQPKTDSKEISERVVQKSEKKDLDQSSGSPFDLKIKKVTISKKETNQFGNDESFEKRGSSYSKKFQQKVAQKNQLGNLEIAEFQAEKDDRNLAEMTGRDSASLKEQEMGIKFEERSSVECESSIKAKRAGILVNKIITPIKIKDLEVEDFEQVRLDDSD